MLSPRAADTDDQLIFSFLNIMGDQEGEHVIELGQKGLRNTVLPHIGLHAFLQPRMAPQLLHIIGIRQKADIKQQIRILGNAILKAEGKNRHLQVLILPVFQENVGELTAELLGQQP